MSGAAPDWFDGFFDADYLSVAPRDPERTERETRFVVERLGLEPGARVLDLACGHGRHTVELARQGFAVTGLDLSEPSLAAAREAAADAGVDAELVHADMRDLPWEREFDAVVNLFTAFGYFADQADDERVLVQVERALRPGGSLLIDVVNLFLLAREFTARAWQQIDDGRIVLEDRAYDLLTGRSNVTWTFVDASGGRSELVHSLRVYTLPELAAMLVRADLEPTETWGDFDGQPYGFESRRLIVHARKRA